MPCKAMARKQVGSVLPLPVPAATTSANPDFGYVTLCDTMDSMILWTKGTLLQTNLNTS